MAGPKADGASNSVTSQDRCVPVLWVRRTLQILRYLDLDGGRNASDAGSQQLIALQGASILTGLGFTGIGSSGESLWEGAANINILEVELPSNPKVLFDSWNINTNIWLRECIYKRVTPKGKKPGFRSTLITFATSAFWVSIMFYFLVRC